MYKTVLVPLDGSNRAEAILSHVEELAQRYQARVILLQVVEPMPRSVVGLDGTYMMLRDEFEQRTAKAAAYLDSVRGGFREKGIETRTRVVSGPVVDAIIRAAEREGADLIAMASHGRSGLSQVFYGSVAAGVLHRIDRPLLLIRSRGKE
jgi:nucleotide-binding universal stress UspA family protein